MAKAWHVAVWCCPWQDPRECRLAARRGPSDQAGIGYPRFQRPPAGNGCPRPAGCISAQGPTTIWAVGVAGVLRQQGRTGRSWRLRAHDLIVVAAGRKISTLGELSAILNGMNPGDRLSLEVVRGIRPLRIQITLAAPPGVPQPSPPSIPPPPDLGARRTENNPPPPVDVAPAPSPEGPALATPAVQQVPPTAHRSRSTNFAAGSNSWSSGWRSWNACWPSRGGSG